MLPDGIIKNDEFLMTTRIQLLPHLRIHHRLGPSAPLPPASAARPMPRRRLLDIDSVDVEIVRVTLLPVQLDVLGSSNCFLSARRGQQLR